jgi:site-specific DNA-methyltransferase (adenine-specific)
VATTAPFELREDGTIVADHAGEKGVPELIFHDQAAGIRLYHGDCFQLLDKIAEKHPEGYADMIFADPPYFLSNGGITCHAGRMVKVDKGDWDKSQGPELNHEFNKEWLARCQKVLKPNGTIWVTGTHHVIFSVGFAMQQLGFKILNDIAWEKPNPPPNLSCRYFTHSTETILWAAKNEKSRHVFNYQAMKRVTGKQMKTVWTMSAPKNAEKAFGKHPTQKPVALIQRFILASSGPDDMVLDPFMGGGTTAIACLMTNRRFVGIEMDAAHISLAIRRTDREIVLIWLRDFRVRVEISIVGRAVLPRRPNIGAERQLCPTEKIDLDLFSHSMDRINPMADDAPKTDCIFHETKFVFLSAAVVSGGSVVHTTVDVSLQEAWAKTPNGKKRETTHIVRCETEILRLKPS